MKDSYYSSTFSSEVVHIFFVCFGMFSKLGLNDLLFLLMSVERGGRGEPRPPWILKLLAKVVFSISRG